jgi:hypothetical protein
MLWLRSSIVVAILAHQHLHSSLSTLHSNHSSMSSWVDVDYSSWQTAMRTHLVDATPAALQAQQAERAALAAHTKALHDLPPESRPAAVPPLIKLFRAHVDGLTNRLAAAHLALSVVAAPIVAHEPPALELIELQNAHAQILSQDSAMKLRLASLTQQLDASRAEMQDVAARAEKYELSIDQLNSERLAHQTHLAECRARAESAESQLQAHADQLLSMRQVEQQRLAELTDLRNQLALREEAATDDQAAETALAQLRLRAETAEQELVERDAQMQQKNAELADVRSQLTTVEQSIVGDAEFRLRAETAERELVERDAQMQQKNAELANLRSQLTTVEQSIVGDAEFRLRAETAERELVERDAQLANLRSQLTTAEQSVVGDAELRLRAERELDERNAQIQQKNAELADLRSQLTVAEQALVTERNNVASTGSVLDSERQQVLDLQKQLAEQRAASDRLFVEQRRTASELVDARRAYDSTVDELQAQRTSAKQSAQKELAAEHALAGVQEAAARAEDRARAARAEQAAAEQAQRDAEQRADAAAAKLDQSERERHASAASAETLRAQLTALQASASGDAGKVQQLVKQLQESVPRQEFADKLAELDELMRETTALREMRDRTRNEVLEAESRADAAVNELELAQHSLRALDDARLAAEQRAEAADSDALGLRARIAALESTIAAPSVAVAAAASDMSDSMSQLEIENSNLKERLDGAREANRTLQQELQALQARIASSPPVAAPVAVASAPATATVAVAEASPELLSVVQRLTHDKAVLSQQVEAEKRRCQDLEEQVLRVKQQLDDLHDARLANRDIERGTVEAPASSGLSCANAPAMVALMWRRLMRTWAARDESADLARSR